MNPFVGLRPFEPEEEHLFFGRDKHTEELLRRLRRSRFLAVVGTSGSGKSSLVRAGLLPKLYGGMMSGAGSRWRVAIFRPGNDPVGELARALERPEVLGVETADEAEARVRATMTESTLRRSARGLGEAARHARLPAGENLLVVVDQFEEIFRFKQTAVARRGDEDAAAFVKLLLEASRTREHAIYVLLTMRSDFLGDCAQFRGLPEAMNDGQFLIPRLNRGERRETITGPVAAAGANVSPRLVQHLLNDVGDDPDQLPVLQHALMRTWDVWRSESPDSEVLDIDAYDKVGRLAAALSRHADEVYEELGDERHRRIAQALFKALTDTTTDPRGVRRPVRLAEVAAIAGAAEAEVIEVVERFRQPGRSFLMPPAGTPLGGETVLDISHESLMRVWERLKGWTEEERKSAEQYLLLARDAARHEAQTVDLLRDPALGLAITWRARTQPSEAWARRYDPAFTRAMGYLESSADARNAEIAQRAFESYWRRGPRMGILAVTTVGFFLAVLLYGDTVSSVLHPIFEFLFGGLTKSGPQQYAERLGGIVLAVPFFLVYLALERIAKRVRRRPTLDAIGRVMAGEETSSYASFGRRLVAFCLDGIVVLFLNIGPMFAIVFLLFIARYDDFVNQHTWGIALFSFFLTWWLYDTELLRSKRQATYGKMALALTVMDSRGGRLPFDLATARGLLKLISVFFLGIPFLWALSTRRKQALHDMATETLVVHRPRSIKALEAHLLMARTESPDRPD